MYDQYVVGFGLFMVIIKIYSISQKANCLHFSTVNRRQRLLSVFVFLHHRVALFILLCVLKMTIKSILNVIKNKQKLKD